MRLKLEGGGLFYFLTQLLQAETPKPRAQPVCRGPQQQALLGIHLHPLNARLQHPLMLNHIGANTQQTKCLPHPQKGTGYCVYNKI